MINHPERNLEPSEWAQQEADRGKWILTTMSYILPLLLVVGFVTLLLGVINILSQTP